LQAQARYWRSRARAALDEPETAEVEAAHARRLMLEIQASLPPSYRDSFAARADIRQGLEWAPAAAQR
jgi:hypothetical protein